jgi:hypothetical protein
MNRIATYLLVIFPLFSVFAQTKPLPTIRATGNRLTMYLGKESGNFNGVNDIPATFSYSFGTYQESIPFSLVSERDSISLTLRYGISTDLRIIREQKGDTVLCHFTSHKLTKAALFNDAYKKANEGKTSIEIPEVYELINVIFALTTYGKTDAIHKETAYYQSVITSFSPFKNNPAVRTIDSLLNKSSDHYHNLKMDSYAYQFDGDQIKKGGIYDRVSWGEENQLTPYIPLLEAFARQSNFQAFYNSHSVYYKTLIEDFRRNVDVARMKSWLEQQFPATKYSAIKVLFSPLVGRNQSANHFEDNGFTEAQMHIDFPFVDTSRNEQSPAITRGQRMKIPFTELNHSYLNPEADKYSKPISVAFGDLSSWTTPNTPSTSSSYSNALSCFEEYMNYALVTLLYYDLFDKKTFDELSVSLEKGMVTNRGFQRFVAFDQELLRLYKTRKPGQTVADLYPAIIEWCTKQ